MVSVDVNASSSPSQDSYFPAASLSLFSSQATNQEREQRRASRTSAATASSPKSTHLQLAAVDVREIVDKKREKKLWANTEPNSINKQEGTKQSKTKALVATCAWQELSEEESRTTVLVWLFGQRFTDKFFRWTRLFPFLSPLSLAGFFFTAYFLLLSSATEETKIMVYWAVAFPCLLSIALHNFAVMNLLMVRQLLRMFDTWWFLIETALLSLTLPFLLCLKATGILYSINLFFGVILGFLSYDSLSLNVRTSVRRSLFLSSVFFFSQFAIIYFRLPSELCFYRLELAGGAGGGPWFKPECSDETLNERPEWSLSLFQFSSTRLYTISILAFKLTYFAHRHPQDCVLIRSHVRLVEAAVAANSAAQLSRASNGAILRLLPETGIKTITKPRPKTLVCPSRVLSDTSTSNKAVVVDTTATSIVAAAEDRSTKGSAVGENGQRKKKKKALVAGNPIHQLTVDDSNTTLMMSLFGSSFSQRWFQKKRSLVWQSSLAVVGYFSVIFAIPLGLDDWTMTVLTLGVMAPSTLYLMLYFSGLMNVYIVRRCLKIFDTRWILLEATVFVFTMPLVFCQRGHWTFGVGANGLIGICFGYLFYDSFPIGVRRSMRVGLAGTAVAYVILLVLFYSRTLPGTCFYRVSWHGKDHFLLDKGLPRQAAGQGEEDGSAAIVHCIFLLRRQFFLTSFTMTLSVFELCCSRFSTLTIMVSKIVATALKHPEDCVLLKSRLRLVETAIIESSMQPAAEGPPLEEDPGNSSASDVADKATCRFSLGEGDKKGTSVAVHPAVSASMAVSAFDSLSGC